MKAEKTRRMLELISMKTRLDVSACITEISGFEKDAEIGRATEKAFETYSALYAWDETGGFNCLDDLLEWATHEGKAGEGNHEAD